MLDPFDGFEMSEAVELEGVDLSSLFSNRPASPRPAPRRGPELLAPAGDLECLQTALHFGADAVYVGGPQLQLRPAGVGFDLPEMEQAVQLCHRRRRRLYVAMNSFAWPEEMLSVGEYARQLRLLGVDAVIVSDLGVLDEVKAAAPDLECHVSTQANCTNHVAARRWHELGASRVVLARELSLEQIAEIRANTPPELELEAFIHGAMCMAWSGRCLLSAYFNGRSGNRGTCTQPCRWSYHLVEEKRPGQLLPVEEEEGGTAILSSYDLNCAEILDRILAAGVDSLKIEGRMKSPYYVATVVNAYRHALDGDWPLERVQAELDCASHRPYSTGFYLGRMRQEDVGEGAYRQSCQFVAAVRGSEGDLLRVEQRNRFRLGDELEVLSPELTGERFFVEELYDEDGNELMSAGFPGQEVALNCPYPLQPGDLLRRRLEPDDGQPEPPPRP